MIEKLLLGTAKVDITPTKPVPLAGFAIRIAEGAFEGVSHPIYARILCFQHIQRHGDITKALLISADILWWGSDRVPQVKRRIYEKWGIEEEAIILHATHTHSGPQMSECFSSYLGSPDLSYIEQMEQIVLDGIGQALSNVESVIIERGTGECRLGVNRRVMQDNICTMEPNGQGPVDHELTVIRYRLEADRSKTKALLVHYACHPVITRENKVSSEFTGVAMERLEGEIGNEAVCAYLQGACGDINPYKDGKFCFGTDSLVMEMGERLAGAVIDVLGGTMKSLQTLPLQAVRKDVQLPLQALPSEEQLKRDAMLTDEVGEWSRMQLQFPERRKPQLTFEWTTLTMAEGLSLLCMNGEIVTAYGLFVKQMSHNQTLPLGYSNGMIGYIPTAKQIEEGGYEPLTSVPYFHMPAPFEPSIEQLIYDALQETID